MLQELKSTNKKFLYHILLQYTQEKCVANMLYIQQFTSKGLHLTNK